MSFHRIESQDKAIKLLKGTLITKKIPNAFIFIGDPYIGKTSTAIAYAKSLNCLNPENDYDSCGICLSCTKIESGLHPDVKVLAPEKDIITVNNIREIEEFVSFQPLEGKYKVVIMKQANKMNQAAANAFLKTVEEPPLNTIIILICENMHTLPEPLVSRCFKVYFKPLSIDTIKKFIPDNPDKENLIRLVMGRPGLLISKDILKDIQWFAATLENVEERNKKSVWKDNEEIKWWIDFLCIFLRDSLVKILKNVEPLKQIDSDCCPILHLDFKLKKNITAEEILELYEELQSIRKNIDLNLNKSILWNYLVSRIHSLIASSSLNKQKL